MSELSAFSLRMALGALVARRKALERRIECASAEEDDEEHLSEEVLDIQRAISEVGAVYEVRSKAEPGEMDLQSLIYSLESAD